MTKAPDPFPELELFAADGFSTEDVLIDKDGSALTGLEDGRIVRISEGAAPRTIGTTNGRPLGLEFLPDGRLLICDAERGVLAMNITNGDLEPLVTHHSGERLNFCNNAAVARDGTIYFSTSHPTHSVDQAAQAVIENVPNGRLLRRQPDGAVDVLLDDLIFANGVALAQDERFVLVAQTGRAQIDRFWLAGDKEGQREIFVQNMPGLPDNISTGSNGLFWVGIAAANDATVALVRRLPLFLRRMIAALPDAMRPKPQQTIEILAYDETGTCHHHFHGTNPGFHMATGVREKDGHVWMGSLERDCIARFKLPG